MTPEETRIAKLRAALNAIAGNCLGYGCDDIARQALWADEQATLTPSARLQNYYRAFSFPIDIYPDCVAFWDTDA